MKDAPSSGGTVTVKATPFLLAPAILLVGLGASLAGPYSAGRDDPAKADAPIPGFVGPDGEGGAPLQTGPDQFINAANYLNPLFFDWASSVVAYAPAPGVASAWSNPTLTLGPVTGDNFHIASLGDLSSAQIAAGVPRGTLTLHFAHPIRNLSGADFCVFENGFLTGSGGATMLADLAYVEVSADGVNFARFPSRSLTPGPVGSYGTIDPTNVRNLAGKHVNAYGDSWGTPFDLAELGLDSISYIRLVDIPGSGAFLDSLGQPIYDAWLTTGSGGADIEAVGAISRLTTFDAWQDLRGLAGADRGPDADPNANGIPNLLEYAFSRLPLRTDTGPAPTQLETSAGRLQITFTRDERATDLTYEVQTRDSLTPGQWTTIASSTAGQPFQPAAGFAPVITETSASPIASVGVIRKVRVSDVLPIAGQTQRFMRVKVTAASAP